MTKVMLVDFNDMLRKEYPIVNDLPKPGYVVGSRFGALVHRWCGRGEPARLGIDVPSLGEVRRLVSEDAMACGLMVQPAQKHGRRLIVEAPGDPAVQCQLERHSAYALSDTNSVMMAMSALLQHIAKMHGPGRIWFVGAPGYLNGSEEPAGQVSTRLEGTDNSTRDEPYAFTPTGDGTRRVVLGAYYFHDPIEARKPVGLEAWLPDEPMFGGLDLAHIEKASSRPGHEFVVPRNKMHEAFVCGMTEIDAALNKHEHTTLTLATRREWVKPLTSEEIACLPVKRKAFAPFTQDEVKKVGPTLVGEMGDTLRIKVKVDPTMQPGEMRIEQFADPLDATYGGVTLRRLLKMDENRRTEHIVGCIISPVQRAAISAHWSVELRAKVAASANADKEREARRVLVDLQDEP